MKIKKKTIRIIIIVIAILISLILAWYIIDSLLLGIVYAILVGLASYMIIKQYEKNKVLFKHIDAAYDFVNLMNVQMLSTNTIYESYKSVEVYLDDDFASILPDDLNNQLLDIANDYNLNSFKMYIKTLNIFNNDGGNYKQMQEIPTSLCHKMKINYDALYSKKLTKFYEITLLYALWFFIMIVLKASVSQYYTLMMDNVIYQFVMLLILSGGTCFYYFAFINLFKNNIRGL